jgi:hypothetical protein
LRAFAPALDVAKCALILNHAPSADHMDYLSVQALLFRRTTVGFIGQIKLFYAHTKRID